MSPLSGLTDRTITISATQDMREQLEVARRALGERSISSTVRRFVTAGLAEHLLSLEAN
jgi:hypothetical protein